MESVDVLLKRDLDYICESLREEFSSMSGKNLLITGGAGFLGYYLVQSALHWNNRFRSNGGLNVTVYDNFKRGVPEWIKNIRHNEMFRLVEHDIVRPLPSDIKDFQYIIHAAGIASPTYYRRYPIETMDTNIEGLRHLLEYSRRQSVRRTPVEGFLFYSSSEVYGDPPPDQIPTSEEYRGNVSCTGPRACYDESKRYGETLCVNFANQYGLRAMMARPFNNYGPGLKITDRRVIPDFVRDVLEGRDIVMLSDGSPTRTFCYSADAIIGYYKILVNGKAGEPYNIGVEKPEVSMNGLAEKIVELARELFGYKGRVVRGNSQEADYLTDNPNRRCPDIQKARMELHFQPTVDLSEGLRRSLIWYHYHRTAEEA